MKNISKTIASLSLSLIAIGAMAQNLSTSHIKLSQQRKAVGPALNPQHVKPGAGIKNMQIYYPNTDGGIFGSAYSVQGLNAWFIDQINNRFVTADTNKAPARQNFNLTHQAWVAFDEIVDGADNIYSATPGTMVVDTIWALVGYKNTTNTNDTVIFSIDHVDGTGYPTATSYTTVTVPMYHYVTFGANVLPGTSVDSLYYIYTVVNYTIPSGSNFAVSVTFNGPKADTFDLAYGFPYSTCSGFDYANTFTICGNTFTSGAPRTINVNSYCTMLQEYYSNVPSMQPEANGCILTALLGANNYEWNVCPASSIDTMHFYEQDYAIAASVTFNDNTSVPSVTGNGLSVGQNYPNPFSNQTQISYSVTKSSDVTFSICDITGRVIMNNNLNQVAPGEHVININANTFSPGVYFYTFDVNGSKVTRKMIITKE